MSSKDEEAQLNELPSYPGRTDGFDYGHDKKEESDPQPRSLAARSVPSSSTAPPPFDAPHFIYPTTSYAPSPAPLLPSTPQLSFSRPPAQGLGFTYAPFKPIFLLAERSTSLTKGFPIAAPPSKDYPHPFVTHDVNEIDWMNFLNEVQVAGCLTEKDIQRSYLPIVSWLPIVGSLSVYAVQKYMKNRKSSTVANTFDVWNHHFFEPRKIRIVLMRGNERLSGMRDTNIGELHSPDPVNVSSGIMDALGSSSAGKGKTKQETDGAYRLFVLSI